MNIVTAILRRARSQPDVPALIDGERSFSYRSLAETVARLAGHLAGHGIGAGDRVGICLKDDWRHVVAVLGVGFCGGVVVPLNWRSRPAELARAIETLALKLVLLEPEVDRQGPAMVADAGWERAMLQAAPFDDPAEDGNAPFHIAASSGSTGEPKYTQASHFQYFFRASVVPGHEALPRPARFLSSTPLCFSAAQVNVLLFLLRGDTVVLQPTLFTADEFAASVIASRATVTYAVPGTIRQLLKLASGSAPLLPGLDHLACSGTPMTAAEKVATLRRISPNFYERYGAAAIGPISALRPQDMVSRPDSVGQPGQFVDVAIVDDAGRPVPARETGRLRLRGAGLGAPVSGDGAPAGEDIRDGWYYPGELASLGEDGFIFLKGRVGDAISIMRAGTKIFPLEIETALREHPDVTDAAVIGHKQPDNEEIVVAFVTTIRPVDAAVLRLHCRTRLTPYKVPGQIRIVADLPRTAAGKIDRATLATMLQ